MNLKKLVPIADHFPYVSFPKKKVVSVSFFIVLCVVFFNVSLKNPVLNNSVFQGLSVNNKTSVISWSFSFVRTPSINSSSVQKPSAKSIVDSDGRFVESGDAHFGNFTGDVKNGSLGGVSDKRFDFGGSNLSNLTNGVKNGSFDEVLDLKGTNLGDFNGDVKNGSFDSNFDKNFNLEDAHLSNFTSDLKNGSFDAISENHSGSFKECDIFDGRWVRDDTKPYYQAGSCPHIDRDFDCHLNKRPDDGYVKWKWQPFGCEIPSLNATDFLERLRGKKLVFVGDSLNRNMWESLICILRDSIPNKNRVYEISGRHEFKKKGFYAFRFEASF